MFLPKDQPLINISNGKCASPAVTKDLIDVKKVGSTAMKNTIESNSSKTSVTKLHTFHSQNKKKSKGLSKKTILTGRSEEVTALLRITQVIASGAAVDIKQCIGEHECHKVPPSLFEENGSMRSGNKASIVKALKERTGITESLTLPDGEYKTAVIIDAMHKIRKLSFEKDETFEEMNTRYKSSITNSGPTETEF